MTGMRRKTVGALCALILLVPVAGCSSDSSGSGGGDFSDGTDYQFWYDHGYEFVDGVVEVDREYGEDAREECVVNADLLAETDADRDALMDGCDARLAEE